MQNKVQESCTVVGIINVTTDSFSDDGIIKSSSDSPNDIAAHAVEQAQRFVDAGCRSLDIGAESTRPGHVPISKEEEIRRIVPVIQKLRSHFPEIALAVDTSKSQVAEQAIHAGVSTLNDVTALIGDPKMGTVIAKEQKNGKPVQVVLMHNTSSQQAFISDKTIGNSYLSQNKRLDSTHFFDQIIQDFAYLIQNAKNYGIDDQSLILDPGIGFGKSLEQNLTLIANVQKLKTTFSLPVYIGASRKSFIGKILNKEVDHRVFGSVGVATVAAFTGADYLRVHDVEESLDAIKMAEHIAKFTL